MDISIITGGSPHHDQALLGCKSRHHSPTVVLEQKRPAQCAQRTHVPNDGGGSSYHCESSHLAVHIVFHTMEGEDALSMLIARCPAWLLTWGSERWRARQSWQIRRMAQLMQAWSNIFRNHELWQRAPVTAPCQPPHSCTVLGQHRASDDAMMSRSATRQSVAALIVVEKQRCSMILNWSRLGPTCALAQR